jgi:serine/threonine protein kinase
MNSPTLSSFVHNLSQSGLLDKTQTDELTQTLQGRYDDPKVLAKDLVKRGWLTSYQAACVYHGKAESLVLGSFVLLERLGEGGMGQVFKARHQRLGRIVALKIIKKERLSNPDAVRRFHHEIRAAAQLRHPNVVLAYDADQADDTLFFAMEYVEGTDLARLVKENGPLPVDKACDYIRQAALGLQHAFENGLVHRDIKPANLLLTAKGDVVKVLDLGLARLTSQDGESTTRLTMVGSSMGTPDYIAPEQAMNSRDVDIRADLYSLGCTLYYLVTGQVPFTGEGLAEKLLKHQLEEPIPVDRIRPGVYADVVQIIRKLMAKKPEDRFQTPGLLAQALEARARPSSSVSVEPAAVTQETAAQATVGTRQTAATAPMDAFADLSAAHVSTKTRPAAPPSQLSPKRHWLLAGAAGFGLLVLLLLLIFRPFGGASPSRTSKGEESSKQAKESKETKMAGPPERPVLVANFPPFTPEGIPAALLQNPNFYLQGEYIGKLEKSHTLAAQVIAEGNERFTVKFMKGGLPGAGWDGNYLIETRAVLSEDSAVWRADQWQGTITRDQLAGQNPDGTFVLYKVGRRSPTEGAKPPAGAVVLFDGSDAGNWKSGTLAEGNLLVGGVKSWRNFTDFLLHIEFREPFAPQARGQARGNSGVYLQDRYEIQILDSFGLNATKLDGGSIFGIAPPTVNVCFPPLAWQTYDIDFRAARFDRASKRVQPAEVTVRHNGFTIHDGAEIPHSTGMGQPEKNTPGPIHLQRQGATVVHFRNVWLVEKQ